MPWETHELHDFHRKVEPGEHLFKQRRTPTLFPGTSLVLCASAPVAGAKTARATDCVIAHGLFSSSLAI